MKKWPRALRNWPRAMYLNSGDTLAAEAPLRRSVAISLELVDLYERWNRPRSAQEFRAHLR